MIQFFEKLYKKDKDSFLALLHRNLAEEKRMFVVTANPEAFMFGEKSEEMKALLLDEATTVVADGIGIVKGGKKIGIQIAERIPGVDIAEKLLEYGIELKKTAFFLGAKQEVMDALLQVVREKYPNLEVVGAVNGYVPDKDAVFEEIKALQPDIVLVALGIPAQERLIYKHLSAFSKGIFVGVGGSFDVLSGTKNRAPKFFIDHNLEWLYRIVKEPARIKRFYDNNVKFLLKLKK
ncbi:MAG: WecB/TagA/CpsF family glycosyltransferase [Clostridia bacterium]|nr:WecB/TagA/CpsF family glycosyltransferase [Clostridia bacterium]